MCVYAVLAVLAGKVPRHAAQCVASHGQLSCRITGNNMHHVDFSSFKCPLLPQIIFISMHRVLGGCRSVKVNGWYMVVSGTCTCSLCPSSTKLVPTMMSCTDSQGGGRTGKKEISRIGFSLLYHHPPIDGLTDLTDLAGSHEEFNWTA